MTFLFRPSRRIEGYTCWWERHIANSECVVCLFTLLYYGWWLSWEASNPEIPCSAEWIAPKWSNTEIKENFIKGTQVALLVRTNSSKSRCQTQENIFHLIRSTQPKTNSSLRLQAPHKWPRRGAFPCTFDSFWIIPLYFSVLGRGIINRLQLF